MMMCGIFVLLLAARSSGPATAPATVPATAPATVPATAPAPATKGIKIDLSTPLSALRASARAMREGDGDTFAACAHPTDAGGHRMLAAMRDWVTEGGRLERAVRTRFGDEAAFEVLDAVPVLFNPWGLGASILEELNDAPAEAVQVQGNRGTLRTRNMEMIVVRVGNQWKLPLSDGQPHVQDYYEQAARHYRQIAQELEGGKYADAESAAEAIGELEPALELPTPMEIAPGPSTPTTRQP